MNKKQELILTVVSVVTLAVIGSGFAVANIMLAMNMDILLNLVKYIVASLVMAGVLSGVALVIEHQLATNRLYWTALMNIILNRKQKLKKDKEDDKK